MRIPATWLASMVVVLGGGLAAAPAIAQTMTTTTTTVEKTITAPNAPPAMRVETVPPASNATEYWKPGHWNWNGADWVWISGAYEVRPVHMVAWVPGHWDPQPAGGFVWAEGHWR